MIPVLRAWNRRVSTPAVYGHCVHALVGGLWLRGVHHFTDRAGVLVVAFFVLVLFAIWHEIYDRDFQGDFTDGAADSFAFLVVAAWEVNVVLAASMALCYLSSVYAEGRKL